MDAWERCIHVVVEYADCHTADATVLQFIDIYDILQHTATWIQHFVFFSVQPIYLQDHYLEFKASYKSALQLNLIKELYTLIKHTFQNIIKIKFSLHQTVFSYVS